MRVLDTNAINYILKNQLNPNEYYYVTEDIKGEAEIAEIVIGRKLSSRVLLASTSEYFDTACYLVYYKYMLNKYGGRSFYNMTGFGDISILALINTVKEIVNTKSQGRLFGWDEETEIFTEDNSLIKKILKENSKTRISKFTSIK